MRDDLRGGVDQRWSGSLVATVSERDQEAAPDGAREHLGPGLRPEAGGQLGGAVDLRLLRLERSREHAAQRQQVLGAAAGLLDQALDPAQVEALGLQRPDKAQARDVLGVVVADPLSHLGRRQQPARLVGADVAHRHAAPCGELLDRQVGVVLLARLRVGGRRVDPDPAAHDAGKPTLFDVAPNSVTSDGVSGPRALVRGEDRSGRPGVPIGRKVL